MSSQQTRSRLVATLLWSILSACPIAPCAAAELGAVDSDESNDLGGTDLVTYEDAAAAVTVSLDDGKASDDGDGGVDTLAGIENVYGSAYDDILTGDDNDNLLYGGDGNDTLEGRGGDDFLHGALGRNRYVFGPGDGNDMVADYRSGDIIDGLNFGYLGGYEEAIVDGDKVITINDDVTITLLDYTGTVTYEYKQLSVP